VKRAKDFETALIKNVIPYTEKTYRAIPNRENRAIGGFSRGGGPTLRAAFGNLNTFAWVCAYSSYLSPEEMNRSYPSIVNNAENTNRQLKLLWVSVGSDDFLYKGTVEFMDFLKAKKVNYKSIITEGGHTWMNVKKYVAETAPLLFQP
jgi:enterochelin esterase family protein